MFKWILRVVEWVLGGYGWKMYRGHLGSGFIALRKVKQLPKAR